MRPLNAAAVLPGFAAAPLHRLLAAPALLHSRHTAAQSAVVQSQGTLRCAPACLARPGARRPATQRGATAPRRGRYMISQHPAVAARLAAELDAAGLLVTPKRPRPRALQFADLATLAYLQAVIKVPRAPCRAD